MNYEAITWVPNPRVRNTGLSEELRTPYDVAETFTPEGKLYPRVTISVCKSPYSMGGFKIEAAIKPSHQNWWEGCAVPQTLLSHTGRLISQVVAKLEGPNAQT